MIKAEIIADSLNPVGNRLTTFVLEYPRFVHAEFMTHRMFSKNAASSRAIPVEKMIQQVIDNPAMPVWWGKNQSGMQANEELSDVCNQERWFDVFSDPFENRKIINRESCPAGSAEHVSHLVSDKEYAKFLWLEARDEAICRVTDLMNVGLHKQIANRILEPWFNIRIICSMTEIENFFALRAHKDAQPEIRELAYQMLEAYNQSQPKRLQENEWHIPFGDKIDDSRALDAVGIVDGGSDDFTSLQLSKTLTGAKIKIAIARCARISYLNFEGKDDYEADIKLCNRLFGSNPKHLSPTEHVAQALNESKFIGNFCGFKQYRYFFNDQSLKDSRVIVKSNTATLKG